MRNSATLTRGVGSLVILPRIPHPAESMVRQPLTLSAVQAVAVALSAVRPHRLEELMPPKATENQTVERTAKAALRLLCHPLTSSFDLRTSIIISAYS